MADTYTPLLRLTKPGLTTAGWGTLVNNGTFQLIDNAIAGIVDVDVSAGDVTLTTANGATDQARYMCLRVINGPVSARNVIVPTLSKIYFVINEGAGPIQIRTATGVALAIMPAGSSTVVRVDTSGEVYHAISQLQGLRLIDPLVPTSGGTGLASYAVGDLLYASSTTAISKLTVGATNAVLTVAAGIPTWTSTLSAVSGGTGQSSFAVGDLLYASSTTAISKLTVGATNAVLTVAAGIPSWVATLPAVSGGTGLSSPGTAGNVLSSNGTTWQSVAVSTLTAATDTVSGVVELATSAEVQTGTDTTRAVTPASLRGGSLVQGTVQNSTSGTVVDFTGIPSWAKRITVMFNGVSTNGSSQIIFQLGTSSGYETSGYEGGGGFATLATGNSNGFLIADTSSASASYVREGQYVFCNMTGNKWTMSGVGYTSAGLLLAAGTKPLSATLDRIRVTTVNGTDTFDAGQINIMYE